MVPDVFIPYLIELHRQGRFPFDRMITEYQGIAQLNDAITAGRAAQVVKAVIAFD